MSHTVETRLSMSKERVRAAGILLVVCPTVVLGWASLLWHWINLFSAPGTCIEAPPDLDAELAQLEAAEGERQEAAKN